MVVCVTRQTMMYYDYNNYVHSYVLQQGQQTIKKGGRGLIAFQTVKLN